MVGHRGDMRVVVMGGAMSRSLPMSGVRVGLAGSRARRDAVNVAAITAAAVMATMVAGLEASAQSGGVEFGSRSACERSARFSAEQCANAFTNAQAEWDEGMPSFAGRDQCVKRFGRCQIAGVSRGKVSFQPVMERVVINQRGGNVTVMPVAPPSAQGGARFGERTILQRKPERSERRQQEAQKRWEALWAAADAGAAGAEGTIPGSDGGSFSHEKPEAFDPNWQKQEGVRTYPGPAARQKKPQS